MGALSWESQTDLSSDYRFQFELISATTGQAVMLARDLQPLNGGNPTTLWRAGDTIVDTYSLWIPPSLSAGSLSVRLSATRQGEPANVSDSSERAVGYVTVGPINVGGLAEPVHEPVYSAADLFGNLISLKGYDFTYTQATHSLDINLQWAAVGHVLDDYNGLCSLNLTSR